MDPMKRSTDYSRRKTVDEFDLGNELMKEGLTIGVGGGGVMIADLNTAGPPDATKKGKAKKQPKPDLSARFPGLVDLVLTPDRVVKYLIKTDQGLELTGTWITQEGILIPPELKAIPFPLVREDLIPDDTNLHVEVLYQDILDLLKWVAILPEESHYHLCTIFIFGKSRMARTLTRLCWRGLITETLNEAFLFRFSDLYGGALCFDMFEISERSQRKGSHDLLLGRFERGMKVARVTAPDKGKFNDTTFYSVFGPTVLATNVDIPGKDPLRSRCIRIVMPEERGVYADPPSADDLMEYRARFLAFRARYIDKPLPEVGKPTPGRLGDLMRPLLRIASLLPSEAAKHLITLVKDLEQERKEAEAETMAGRIVAALFDLQSEIVGGRLPVENVREKVNEDLGEKWKVSPQRIGRELASLGILRKKVGGEMKIEWNMKLMGRLFDRFNLPGDNSPLSPHSQNRYGQGENDGESENWFLP
jgi:hypothetical protein